MSNSHTKNLEQSLTSTTNTNFKEPEFTYSFKKIEIKIIDYYLIKINENKTSIFRI